MAKEQKKTPNAWEDAEGIEVLNRLFDVNIQKMIISGFDKHTGRLRPFRRKPGVPNMRPDAELNARRKKRKAQRLARRRNR